MRTQTHSHTHTHIHKPPPPGPNPQRQPQPQPRPHPQPQPQPQPHETLQVKRAATQIHTAAISQLLQHLASSGGCVFYVIMNGEFRLGCTVEFFKRVSLTIGFPANYVTA